MPQYSASGRAIGYGGKSKSNPVYQPKHRVPSGYAPNLGGGARVKPSRTRVLGIMGGRLGATASGHSRGSRSAGAPHFRNTMPVQTRPHGVNRKTGEQRPGTPARFMSRRVPSTRGFLRRQLPNG